MKRIALAILAIAFVIGSVAPSFAVEMNARGSWRAAASWWDYSNDDADYKDETFRARQRARIWFDFVANENLKAVLGLEIGDITWGSGGSVGRSSGGGLATDGVNIETKHAYIDFTVPNTSVNIKAGLQPIYIPGNLGSPIMDDDAAALMISAPINDMVSIAGGWVRAVDLSDGTSDSGFAAGASNKDEYDTFALLVPVNADGFSVTPYLLYSMIGQNVGIDTFWANSVDNGVIDQLNDVLNAAGLADLKMTDDATMWHAGFSTKVDMFDPIVLMMDAAYGSMSTDTNYGDLDVKGYFFDLAVDYKMDFMTPELFFYYTSGADDDDDTISVFPAISPDVNFSTFGTDGSALGEGDVLFDTPAAAPIWAIGLKLKNISLIEDLSHTFTLYYAKGTSDEDSLYADTFDEKDSLIEVNFDTKYQIYDELAAYLELGYINFDFDDEDSTDSAYKAALGIRYDF